MDADAILNKLRLRGIDVVAIGNAISLTPKRLVNDQMVAFIRKHKEYLLTALYQEEDKRIALHKKRKYALRQGRLEVFRILLRRFLNDAKCREMVNFKGGTAINDKTIEDYLDSELINFGYDIDAAIEMYQAYTPKPVVECKCRYQRPFCSCGGVPCQDSE